MAEIVSRRQFLQSAAGMVSVAAQRRPVPQRTPPIVVIGAGMAGLRAADRLEAAGSRVAVLEGRERSGGRVATLRVPFSPGLYGELGPIRIAGQHQRLLAIIARFGLPLVPFASGSGESLVVARGMRARSADVDRVSEALGVPREDRGLTQQQLLQKYVGELPSSMSDADVAFDPRWTPFDSVRWPTWLRARGASDASIALMTLGGDSRELSALYVLRQYALLREGALYKIEGGMDQIPRAMASALDSTITYGARVTRLEPGRTGVVVEYLRGGRRQSMTASRVILTVPAPVLSTIATSSAEFRSATSLASEIPFFPATRFLLEATRRAWHDQDLNGAARTDAPAEIWEAAYEANTDGGVLAATVGGQLGKTLAGQSRSRAIRAGVNVIERAFGKLPVRTASVRRWALDPWARGAFAVFRPGQMSRLVQQLPTAVGRIHFAGEHTSPWTGWMEGALESADRAVAEVLS